MDRGKFINASSRKLGRREFLRLSGTAAAGFLAARGLPGSRPAGKDRKNVLFIIVDDLRPELGCYGNPVIRTPRIDELAKRGVAFSRAYCQEAMCNPSRASVLTGKRPDSIHVWDQSTHFRDFKKSIVTLPQYFKREGYRAVGIGKVFHTSAKDPQSWSRGNPKLEIPYPYLSPESQKRQLGRELAARSMGKSDSWIQAILRGPAVENYDAPEDRYLDGKVTQTAIRQLRKLSEGPPFFLAVGFYKPHLPFVAPKRYWDLYDPEKIPEAENPFPPRDAPPFALNNMFELACYDGFGHVSKGTEGQLPQDQRRLLKHGYYACVSFIDAQVGRLLDEIDRLGIRDNTIIVLWGDHGWKLGEHRSWCKQTNYEVDLRSPLIITAPGLRTAGSTSPALVECVDIFPTLCQLSGLDVPQGLEGISMLPLLETPVRPWKKAAFSQFPRGFQGRIMGYTIRTERYRYVEWRDRFDNSWIAHEIYDHQVDPQENINIAGHPENQALATELSKILWDGWWKALPD